MWNVNMKREQKRKTLGYLKKLLHETLKNKYETFYLNFATANIKYDYVCNSKLTTSNIKCRTVNMKRGQERKILGYLKNYYMKY